MLSSMRSNYDELKTADLLSSFGSNLQGRTFAFALIAPCFLRPCFFIKSRVVVDPLQYVQLLLLLPKINSIMNDQFFEDDQLLVTHLQVGRRLTDHDGY